MDGTGGVNVLRRKDTTKGPPLRILSLGMSHLPSPILPWSAEPESPPQLMC
jgi:hypothetical protein